MRKTLSILLSLIMVFSVFTVIPITTAGALNGVAYIDAHGAPQTANGVTAITSGSTALSTGWYAVTADTEINDRITCTGDVHLILCNDTELTAHKGITVSGEDNSLTIYGQAAEENAEPGELLIDQVDESNAGIGGCYQGSGNNITINGGEVTATGGEYAAGIGGGEEGSGNNITINGGTVTVTGSIEGAGIGGGFEGSGENIIINGGTVTAEGGEFSAGIGGGVEGSGNSITINGGIVTVTGGYDGAGIGGGSGGSGNNISINDGTVIATGGNDGAGIGGGYEANGEKITINGGSVTATGGDVAAGIGGGEYGSGENIIIYNGSVTATGGEFGAGIGGGSEGSGNTITINGGTVIATGGDYGAGIGGGDEGSGNVVINGGTVTAAGGSRASGIGGGWSSNSTVTINGGTVIATGGDNGAGIGDGRFGSGGNITLSWSDPTDSITASSYNGTVTLNKVFTDGTNVYYPGVVGNNSSLAGKKLAAPHFTVTWKNWDDTILKTDEQVFLETVPVYNGETPTKEDDAQHSYTFAGWKNGIIIYDADEPLPVVTDDVTYTAVFVPDGYVGYASILTEPTAKFELVYTGEPMELINAGTAKHGTMYYKLGDGEWSTQLPKATEPGTYTVTYKAVGDESYFDSEEESLTVSVVIGNGSQNAPYPINSTADWDAFVDEVNSGNTYEGKFIKLTADIAVTRNVGDTREHIFKGTFNGDGHTVTVDITDNNTQGVALFRSIADATIRNLTVAGTVNSTQHHAAGLFGFAESGTNLIESCTVTATINGGEYAGGVYGHGIKSTVTVKNCVFSGLIKGRYNATLGVFQGWSDDNICTVDNCLYIQQNGQATNNLAYVKNVAELTVNSCYKTGSTIDDNGTLAYSITCGENIELELGDASEYRNGLTTYAVAKAFGGVVYAPANATIRVAVSDVGEENCIKVNESTSGNSIPVSASGSYYYFTMPSADILVEIVPREFFSGHSITLSGDIGVNYYVELSDEEVDSGAVVDFLWTVDGVEQTDSVTLTASDKTANGYRATCPVAVAEMTYDVTATLTVGGVQYMTDTYSVKQYADTILSDDYKTAYLAANHTETEYKKLSTLVKTMLNYGARAQEWFDRNLDHLADEGIDYDMAKVTASMITPAASDMSAGLDAYGLKYEGSTIVYLSKTSLRHYYTITDQAKFDLVKDCVMFDAEPAEYHTKNGQIYFEVTDIGAADLDTPYPLQIGTNIYSYTVLDYVRECIKAKYTPYQTMLLVFATYWYNQAANAYFRR